MTDEQDMMRVIDDAGAPAVEEAGPAWKIAVIDDDAAVHEGTRFALYDYSLHGQGIEIISEDDFEKMIAGATALVTAPTPGFAPRLPALADIREFLPQNAAALQGLRGLAIVRGPPSGLARRFEELRTDLPTGWNQAASGNPWASRRGLDTFARA